MAYQKQYDIADAILKKTIACTLKWDQSFKDLSFDANFTNHTVRFSENERYDEYGTPYTSYVISVINDTGKIIESFSDEDLDREADTYRPLKSNHYREEMRDAFRLIKRKALGVEDALDEILSQMK